LKSATPLIQIVTNNATTEKQNEVLIIKPNVMNEKIKKQQTLFRFVSLRAPEKSKSENQEKRFVFHPDNKSGVFFNTSNKKKKSTSKWSDLQAVANKFQAFQSEQDVSKINPSFYKISEWLALNKSTATDEEVIDKIKSIKVLDAKTVLKLWDNLFYQVVLQKDFYVKEAVIQMLVLQNLVKHKKETSQINNLVNAKVVLPKELFDISNFNNSTAKKQIKKVDEVWDKDLENAKNIETAKIKIENTKAILKELKKIGNRHSLKYQTEYDKEVAAYQQKTKPLIEKYQNDYAKEYRKLYREFKNHEEVKTIIDVTQPKITEFTFNYPLEIEVNSIAKLLNKEIFEVLSELIDLQNVNSVSEIEQELEQLIENENNTIVENQQLTEPVITFGDTVIPASTVNPNPFAFNVCSFLLINKPNKVGISMNINLPNTSIDISSFIYHLETTNGTTTDGYYEAVKNGNVLTLRKLFNDTISTSINNTIEQLTGEITFSNGQKYTFEINPFSFNLKPPYGRCFKGRLQATIDDVGNPIDDNGTFIPNKFGYRQLGIADYKKVVSEVCCYEVGEVAHIENIMAKELREKITTKFHQRQIIETESNEIETEKISDTTSTERFEMQSEISKLLQEQRQFNANVNVHTSWGTTTLDASAGYASNTSKEESNRQAVQQSKELTERAMERVVSRVKNEKTTTTTEEFTEENAHRFDNTLGKEHVSGVFRFINAIYKNQIFNYGKRLMYEFMVPQPSKLHRLAMSVKKEAEQLKKPVNPRVLGYTDFRTITKNNYQKLASDYNSEVEIHKDETINVSQHYLKENWSNDGRWHKSGEFVIKIPEHYTVEIVKGYFDPRHGNHSATWNNMGGTIYIGTKRVHIPHRTSDMNFQLNYIDENIEKELSLTMTTWDIATYNFNIIVECKLTDKAKTQWQKNTYEAILKGYEEQLRVYNEKLAQIKSTGIQILDSNPLFYRQIEQNVLRENCISYLLDNQNPNSHKQFGLKMYNDNSSFTDYKITQNQKMDNYASFAKFMEQAFEWNLMSYHFYPYYWGNKEDWSELYQFETNDATFRSFMQSGMARVVVTVKPGFEDAVMLYMATGQIWNGGQMPVLGDPLYLSIVDELAEQEYVVEETWNTVLPTHLIALQKSGVAVDAEGLPCGDNCKDFSSGSLTDNDNDLGVVEPK